MEIVNETYRQINLGDRPLARRRYRFSEIRKVKLKDDGSLTSSILLHIRRQEKKYAEESGLLSARQPVRDSVYDEYTSSLSMTSESFMGFSERERLDAGEDVSVEQAAIVPPKQPRLKRLQAKISDRVFDYSEIEQEKVEQEIDQLVNADGYYNEVEPADIDVDYKEERHINKPALIAAAALIIYIILILKF